MTRLRLIIVMIMKGSSRTLLIFVLALLVSPSYMSAQNHSVTIHGKVPVDSMYRTIVLEDYSRHPQVVATSPLGADGSFQFTLNLAHLDFLKLKLGDDNYLPLILLPGEQITITSGSEPMSRQAVIMGSPHSSLLLTLSREVARYDKQFDSLYQSYKTLMSQQDDADTMKIASLVATLKDLDTRRKDDIRQFAQTHPESPANLYYLNRLDVDKDLPTFIKVDDALYRQYPENSYVKELNYTVDSKRYVQPGMPAPDISLPDPDGRITTLSSLKGHIVLVDFWASWCGPCRKENPNVVRMYRKYHDKGFEVYGVSLDTDRNRWLQTIKNDSLLWTQVSDLKKWNSEAAKTYAVRAIPFSVLVDREGSIIATNLRGPDLANKLQELFGF
jgi:thiol-disulfide isomerase/thioredoxin